MTNINPLQEDKVGIGCYVALIFACVYFSGILSGTSEWYGVFDFSVLNGSFGKLVASVGSSGEAITTTFANFRGKGGSGALDGFIFALTLAPTVMFAIASITVLEHYGALRAARKLLTPLLRPLVGIPGSCCLAFISSLQTTDGGAALSRQLKDSGEINEDEADIFAMLQLSADATLANYMGSGMVLLSLTSATGETVPTTMGVCLVLTFIMKFVGANVARFIFKITSKKKA